MLWSIDFRINHKACPYLAHAHLCHFTFSCTHTHTYIHMHTHTPFSRMTELLEIPGEWQLCCTFRPFLGVFLCMEMLSPFCPTHNGIALMCSWYSLLCESWTSQSVVHIHLLHSVLLRAATLKDVLQTVPTLPVENTDQSREQGAGFTFLFQHWSTWWS